MRVTDYKAWVMRAIDTNVLVSAQVRDDTAGCDDFVTLDTDLVKRAVRSQAGAAKVAPVIFKL